MNSGKCLIGIDSKNKQERYDMERILKKTYRTAPLLWMLLGSRDLYFCGLRIEMFLHVCFHIS